MSQEGDNSANGAFVSIEFEVFGQVQGKAILNLQSQDEESLNTRQLSQQSEQSS